MNGFKSTAPIIPSSESHYELDYVGTHARNAKAKTLQCKVDDLHCRLCGMNFGQNKVHHQAHFSLHRQQSIFFYKSSGIARSCSENSEDTEKDEKESTFLVQLLKRPKYGNLKLTYRNGRITSSVFLNVKNTSSHSIQLTDFFLFNDDIAMPLIDAPEFLAPGEVLNLNLINATHHSGKVNDYVLRYLQSSTKTELIEVHRLDRCCNTLLTLQHADLKSYNIPQNMKNIVKTLKERVAPCQLNSTNYVATFKQFIQLEEYDKKLELESFNFNLDLTDANFRSLLMPRSYSITILNVVPKFPLLKKFDQFWMKPKGKRNLRDWILAYVTDILNNEIHFHVGKKKPVVYETYRIEFILHRLQFQMEHRAIEIMDKFKLITLMFPASLPEFSDDYKIHNHIKELKWFNNDIKNNPEQRQAVFGIVNGVSYPAPYLIFGPPGTGKTATITEAICQLVLTQPNSRILVTATSNAAADELALRLLKYLRNACYFNHNVYRLYASNVLREVTDPQLLANSNYSLSSLPDWIMLSKYRVIISTLMTSGRLMLVAPKSSAKHFSHLFIDECGSATETAALIPIAVCSSSGKINANIILAGDPKQLGPVVQSEIADRLGFGESLIARFMNMESYQRDAVTKMYCSRMLTQLLKNFRSHPDIINISNDIFYNSELQPCASIVKTHRYLGWWKLPVKNVPILFDATVGIAQKEGNSHSWFNKKEIHSVIYYVNLLLMGGIKGKRISEDDIGIISPYKRQCQKIEMELRRHNYNIMTASVELFQGKEKSVIIVSTVRSGQQGIGFLDNPKRLNVLLTRAQSLMILIGNPNVLQKDRNWYAVLERLTKLGVMTGQRFVLSPKRLTGDEGEVSDKFREEDRISAAVNALQLI